MSNKIIIKKDSEGKLTATITVDFDLGKVLQNDRDMCFLHASGAMNIQETYIHQLIDKRASKNYSHEQKYKDIMTNAEEYFKAKLWHDLGLSAINLTLTPDGKILGLREGFEFDIKVEDESPDSDGDDGLVQCGKCKKIMKRSDALLCGDDYLYICDSCAANITENIEAIWKEFMKTPVNEKDETIERSFYTFPAGTWIFDILDWFESYTDKVPTWLNELSDKVIAVLEADGTCECDNNIFKDGLCYNCYNRKHYKELPFAQQINIARELE